MYRFAVYLSAEIHVCCVYYLLVIIKDNLLSVIKKLILINAAPLLLLLQSNYESFNRYIECIGIIYSLKYWAKNE